MAKIEKTPAIEIPLYKGKVKVKFFPDSHQYWVDGKRVSGVTTIGGIKDKSTGLVSWAVDTFAEHLLNIIRAGEDVTEKDVYAGAVAHTQKKEAAANTGNDIHDWIEQYIKFKLKIPGAKMPSMPEEKAIQIGINSFLDWEAEHKVKYVSSEKIVYSKKYNYIGTLDIEAFVDGDLCLIDIKTGNALYNDVRLQTAGYVKADEEECGKKKYTGRWAIRIAKETEAEYIVRMEKKNAMSVFNGKEPKEIAPYRVFEAKYLDETKGNIEMDFEGFLAALTLFKWNKATDFYYNK